VLDKFMGDAVMAVYGAPLSSGRDPENAVASAIAMMGALASINERRRGRGQTDLRLGIGIASGDVVAGTIGSTKRMDYTVIGDSVNLASRLQNLTKHYQAGIVVCEATAAKIDPAHLRPLDLIRVRGRARPERIFQVLTYLTPESFPHKDKVLAHYAEGAAHLAARDFAAAVAAFEAGARLNSDDRPTQLQLERARILLESPPPDWDGVMDWSGGD
jgi:adenylate cyclase